MEDMDKKEIADKTEEKKVIQFSLTDRIINSGFAIIALVLFALYKILVAFNVMPVALNGIMAILIISLAVVGVIWNLIRCKKPTLEFVFSAGVAVLTFGLGGIL